MDFLCCLLGCLCWCGCCFAAVCPGVGARLLELVQTTLLLATFPLDRRTGLRRWWELVRPARFLVCRSALLFRLYDLLLQLVHGLQKKRNLSRLRG